MKTLVIYDSVFGNTEKIAAAMADATGARAVKISDATPDDIKDMTLLIVGSPTRAFHPTPAVTKWLKALPRLGNVRIAAFDTRIDKNDVNNKFLNFMMRLFGYAAEPIHKALVKKGGAPAADPAWFFVTDSEGSLRDGELERAAQWALSAAGK
jgi:flavodoxin